MCVRTRPTASNSNTTPYRASRARPGGCQGRPGTRSCAGPGGPGRRPPRWCASRRSPCCTACSGPWPSPVRRRTAVPQCRWCSAPASAWPPGRAGQQRRAAPARRHGSTPHGRGAGPGVSGKAGHHLLRDQVKATVPDSTALAVATVGAEASGGYAAALLLGPATLAAAPGKPEGGGGRGPALVRTPLPRGGPQTAAWWSWPTTRRGRCRWDPAGYASRELALRQELQLPPAVLRLRHRRQDRRRTFHRGPPTAPGGARNCPPDGRRRSRCCGRLRGPDAQHHGILRRGIPARRCEHCCSSPCPGRGRSRPSLRLSRPPRQPSAATTPCSCALTEWMSSRTFHRASSRSASTHGCSTRHGAPRVQLARMPAAIRHTDAAPLAAFCYKRCSATGGPGVIPAPRPRRGVVLRAGYLQPSLSGRAGAAAERDGLSRRPRAAARTRPS